MRIPNGAMPCVLSAICVTGHLVLLLLLNNVFRGMIVVREMNECATQFDVDDLANDRGLIDWINTIPRDEAFGVIMLNEYALEMTLNWLCNTNTMPGVHNRTLFFTLDEAAEMGLKSFYPNLQVYRWYSPCLQKSFKPADATYMSFFLLRTNLMRALLRHDRSFWMLQADTFWRANLFSALDWRSRSGDVILDQQGFEGTGEARKQQMNGANFLLPANARTGALIEDLHWYQTRFYVTDPDAVKIMCNARHTPYNCQYIDHRIVSGWEWVYGDQRNPPYAIQMDGETEGGKVETLKRYRLWFLNQDLTCNRWAVNELKQTMLLAIGEFLNDLPIFGQFYRVYGGLPSLYLQFF